MTTVTADRLAHSVLHPETVMVVNSATGRSEHLFHSGLQEHFTRIRPRQWLSKQQGYCDDSKRSFPESQAVF